MTRLSNETVAEQTATLAGAAVMLLGLLTAEPGVVFATGIAMVHTGLAFSCFSCFSSTRAIRRVHRLRYMTLSLIASLALVGMVGWIVWDYTMTLVAFSVVVALALLSYALLYLLARVWLRHHRDPIIGTGDGSTEPADARESPS